MWNLTSFHLDTVLVSVQDRCMVCAGISYAQKSFWTHPMVPLGYKAQVKPRFDPFGDSANLDADWCMVCAERTLGSEIVLDAPN